MGDISIRKTGKAGHITLTRPQALNALTYDMVLQIETALDAWKNDEAIEFIILDAEGEKALCAGGDIKQMYETGTNGDFDYGRRFWRDEYRLNAKIANYAKPYIAFMQGFTMGGGVGISCHGSHRIVGRKSYVAMPECSIGLVPDVGSTLLLANAPGRIGEFLAMTGARMNAGDALHAGFATDFVPENKWPELKSQICETGDLVLIGNAAEQPAEPIHGWIRRSQEEIDRYFSAKSAIKIETDLDGSVLDGELTEGIGLGSPLSVCCSVELIRRVRANPTIEHALSQEFRFVYRSASQGDFLEGIRARVIEKGTPADWKHMNLEDVTQNEIDAMLAPLGSEELELGASS